MWSLKEKEIILILTFYNFCTSIVILNIEVTIHMICRSYLQSQFHPMVEVVNFPLVIPISTPTFFRTLALCTST